RSAGTLSQACAVSVTSARVTPLAGSTASAASWVWSRLTAITVNAPLVGQITRARYGYRARSQLTQRGAPPRPDPMPRSTVALALPLRGYFTAAGGRSGCAGSPRYSGSTARASVRWNAIDCPSGDHQ